MVVGLWGPVRSSFLVFFTSILTHVHVILSLSIPFNHFTLQSPKKKNFVKFELIGINWQLIIIKCQKCN
jgi:hypothetical protein